MPAPKTILLVEDNSAPPMVFTLKRDGTAIDVTGCTVKLIIAKGGTITNASNQTCDLTTPASGVVTFTPIATDFPSAGAYKADFEITYADATVERLYDQVRFKARRKIT